MKTILLLPLAVLSLGGSAFAEELVKNGDLEKADASGSWPDGWAKPKAGGEWGKEGANHFISLKSTKPGEMVMLYQEFKIPAGTKQVQLSWKQKITGLKRGAQPWFDARILLEFANAERAKMPGKPKAPNTGKDTSGWEEKSVMIDVPENAAFLQFMPCLFQAEAGTFELDDISLKAVAAPAGQ
jgi:endoglucanase